MARDEGAARVQRSPFPVPEDASDLPAYLQGEFQRIWDAISALQAGHLPRADVAPDRPRDGDIRYADGTNWNPGSGEGAYIYYGAAWNKMG